MRCSVLARAPVYSALGKTHSVLLLGWGGATDKALAKYSQNYESRGLDCTRFIATLRAFSSDGRLSGMRDMTGLYSHLDELILTRRRLIVHTFSMNGVLALCALLDTDKYRNLLKDTDAIVFDSGPVSELATPYLVGYANLVKERGERMASTFKRLVYYAGCFLYSLAITAQAAKWRAQVAVGYYKEADVNAAVFLREHPDLPRLQAFLYSDGDDICTAKSIAAYHDYIAASRGCDIITRRFSTSPHVMHYLRHPKDYECVIDGVLRQLTLQSRVQAKL